MYSTATQDSGKALSANAIQSGVHFAPGMALADVEKMVILETLRHLRFNRTRAARVLGIGIRTLQRKLKQYNLESGNLTALS